MTINSRQKGVRGELEVAHKLTEAGFDCRRDGRLDTDLDHCIDGTHIEVKRSEKPTIGSYCAQAEKDAKAASRRTWTVIWRSNRRPWVAIMPLDEYLRLKQMEAQTHDSP